jgi:hypothetical protein
LCFLVGLHLPKKKKQRMKKLIQFSAAVLAMLLLCHPARSQTLAQIKKTVASDRGANDYFGYSVAIAGDYMVVGAYKEDEDASGANTVSNEGSAAYVFKPASGSLPVDLVSFAARVLPAAAVQLNWQTASELNNNYFDVERSYDAMHWDLS